MKMDFVKNRVSFVYTVYKCVKACFLSEIMPVPRMIEMSRTEVKKDKTRNVTNWASLSIGSRSGLVAVLTKSSTTCPNEHVFLFFI